MKTNEIYKVQPTTLPVPITNAARTDDADEEDATVIEPAGDSIHPKHSPPLESDECPTSPSTNDSLVVQALYEHVPPTPSDNGVTNQLQAPIRPEAARSSVSSPNASDTLPHTQRSTPSLTTRPSTIDSSPGATAADVPPATLPPEILTRPEPAVVTDASPPKRRSARTRRRPGYLDDFETSS